MSSSTPICIEQAAESLKVLICSRDALKVMIEVIELRVSLKLSPH